MTARRAFLKMSFALTTATIFPFVGRSQGTALSDQQTKMVEWMDAATGVGREIAGGTLSVTRFADAFWYLSRGIKWSPGPGQNLPTVSVPIGFVTDFASIPRALWTALPRDGDYVWAAVVHDYLYWSQTTTKDVADDVFNAAMIDFKIPSLERLAIYEAVHTAGSASWDSNARLKADGEKRILTRYPDSPTITWEEWKQRPDVF